MCKLRSEIRISHVDLAYAKVKCPLWVRENFRRTLQQDEWFVNNEKPKKKNCTLPDTTSEHSRSRKLQPFRRRRARAHARNFFLTTVRFIDIVRKKIYLFLKISTIAREMGRKCGPFGWRSARGHRICFGSRSNANYGCPNFKIRRGTFDRFPRKCQISMNQFSRGRERKISYPKVVFWSRFFARSATNFKYGITRPMHLSGVANVKFTLQMTKVR